MKSLHIPVEYLYTSQKRELTYEKSELSSQQLQTFKKFHQIDYILYELSLEKLDRQVTEFGKLRMQREVRKLQQFAASCQKSRSCFKSKFTTIRDSPNASDLLRSPKLKGNKIETRLDKDYGKFKVRNNLSSIIFYSGDKNV